MRCSLSIKPLRNAFIFFNLFYWLPGAKVWIGIFFYLELVDIMVTNNTQGHHILVGNYFFLYKGLHEFICSSICCKYFKIHIFICIWRLIITFSCSMFTAKLWVARSVKMGFSSKQIYFSYFTKQTTMPIILQVPRYLFKIDPSRLFMTTAGHRTDRCLVGMQIYYLLLSFFFQESVMMKAVCLVTLLECLFASG